MTMRIGVACVAARVPGARGPAGAGRRPWFPRSGHQAARKQRTARAMLWPKRRCWKKRRCRKRSPSRARRALHSHRHLLRQRAPQDRRFQYPVTAERAAPGRACHRPMAANRFRKRPVMTPLPRCRLHSIQLTRPATPLRPQQMARGILLTRASPMTCLARASWWLCPVQNQELAIAVP